MKQYHAIEHFLTTDACNALHDLITNGYQLAGAHPLDVEKELETFANVVRATAQHKPDDYKGSVDDLL